MSDLLARLAAPLPPAKISWRVGSTTGDKKRGMALAYIDARDVMARLDDAAGAAGWQDRYEFHGPRTVCYLSIKIGDDWITKADGAGDSDVEAEKGAISDAFKRAAVKWGIGRYLYDIETPWVAIEPHGKSYVIAPGEFARLAKLLPGSVQRQSPPPDNGGNPFDDPDFEALAEQLSKRVRAAKSNDDIAALWGSDDFKQSFKTLPAAYQDVVKNVGAQRREAISQRKAA